MVPNLSVISSSSTGSSTRATQLYRPGECKPLGSSSWSAKVTGPLLNSISPFRRSGNKLAEDQSRLAPPEQGSPGSNEGNKSRLSKRRKQRKSVTFEDNNVQESNAEDAASPAGTVRIKILPSTSPVRPIFYAQNLDHGYSGNDQETVEFAEQSDTQPIVNDYTPYEQWRELRKRLERTTEPRHSSAPDERFLRPKRRSHTRTVSHEDVLTGRGANPRTGVVSPSIVSGSSRGEDSRGDLGNLPGSHRWRLKGDQWISIDTREESPTPTRPAMENPPRLPDNSSYWRPQRPPNEHIPQKPNAAVPLSELEDRFVVNMPSAREPCPPTMTAQQIEDFQRSISRSPGLSPNGQLSPVHEARGEPPKMPERRFSILRKAVGSSPSVSRRKQPDRGHAHPIKTMKPPEQSDTRPSTSPAAIPTQRQYYDPDEVGRDLVGSTYNRQVSNHGERGRNVSQHPFLDVSGVQGNEREILDGTPLSQKMNSSPPQFLTSVAMTGPIITGEQEPALAGTQHSGQNLQKAQQNSPNLKQCQCPSHTIPNKVSQKRQWLRNYLHDQRKGQGQPTRMKKENHTAIASTGTSTSTTTSTPITTSSLQDQVTDQKQTVNPLSCTGKDGIACAHHTNTDHEGSHPRNEIDPQAQAWNRDAVNCNIAPQKTVPSYAPPVTVPAQITRSQVPSDMPGYTHMQGTPNGDVKMNAPSGERCARCQGYYYVRDNKQKVFPGLKKSYTLVEQSCVRPVPVSRNGKLYRRNTDGAPMALVEADRPCCGSKAVLKKSDRAHASASANQASSPQKKDDGDSSNDLGFLDPLVSLWSESYTLLQQNRAFQHTKTIVNRLFSMSAHCFDVVVRIYDSCCVYSQTGSWPQFKDQELNRLMRDLGRAGIYLVVLAIVAALLGRVWTYIVMVGSWFLWVIMPVRWALGRVFGMMFSSD